jgi:preprotein translocase subunit SecF|tara:strand:+ start:21 stop:878 length:858 start_codon:yes stop_codon:yes gene_type:complete
MNFINLPIPNLKKLMAIPIIFLLLSVSIVALNLQSGTVPLGIDLKGGTMVTVYGDLEKNEIIKALEPHFGGDLSIDTISDISGVAGYTIQMDTFLSISDKENLQDIIVNLGVTKDSVSIRDAQASISSKTLKDGIKALIFAFIFMALIVFIRFRTVVPSFAVVVSAFSDIIVTIAIMIIVGIPLTTGSLVALLLLIGYSVDTDILLTTRVLVRTVGSFEERLQRAMKTGLTMASTTLLAVGILFIASSSTVLKDIAIVLLIGLIVDLMNTWIQNARILQWHLERS